MSGDKWETAQEISNILADCTTVAIESAATVTDELRSYARGYFPDITDEQIVANYCVLRTLCTNERDKWSRFRDGTAQETISLVPIIDKFTGEIRPAYKEA